MNKNDIELELKEILGKIYLYQEFLVHKGPIRKEEINKKIDYLISRKNELNKLLISFKSK